MNAARAFALSGVFFVCVGSSEAVTIVTSTAPPYPGEQSLASVVGGFAPDAVEVFPASLALSGRYRGEILYVGTTPISEPLQVHYIQEAEAPVLFLTDTPLGQIAEVLLPDGAYGFMLHSITSGENYTQDALNGGRKQAIILHSASTGTYFVGFEEIASNNTASGDFNDLVFRLQPVPEPRGVALLLLGAGGAMVRRRRTVGHDARGQTHHGGAGSSAST